MTAYRDVLNVVLDEMLAKIDLRKDGCFIEKIGRDAHSRTIRIGFHRPDIYTGEIGIGYGGTATIPEDATRGDIMRTVLGLFLSLEEHEAREAFWVDGVQPFSPHITYEAHMEAARHIQGHPELES